MTSKTTQKALIAQFIAFTGATEKAATKNLKISGWKLDQACDSYYASTGSAPPTKGNDNLTKQFEKYRSPTDEEGVITVEGTMSYLQDLGINLNNAELLVALEIIQAPALGEMSKEGFVNGWKDRGFDVEAKISCHGPN